MGSTAFSLTAVLLAGVQLWSLEKMQQNPTGEAGPGLRVLLTAG